MTKEVWEGFTQGNWQTEIDVAEFIKKNYTPYEGDGKFLANATDATNILWKKVSDLKKRENKKGILSAETKKPSGITSYGPGYVDAELEKIVGLQTDKPLKRAIFPYGGLRVVQKALEEYGYKLNPRTEEIFSNYRKTHNAGVFDVYTDEMLRARKSGIITGLPDAYGRGRIIGDYRRVALYGTKKLIEQKMREKKVENCAFMFDHTIITRENISEGIRALQELEQMAKSYGFDISQPATNAREAIQWTYFAYLAAIKQQDGAAMSLGRVSTFLDIYIERDIKNKTLTEVEAQELIDHFIMKLRMVRFLRTQEYNKLFSGDPTWVTECIGGMGEDGRTMVTKTSFRFLHTLYNLGPAPEPNLTVLWNTQLPEKFKNYCAQASIDTNSIQYESDDLMRNYWGDDYAIACCVSAMRVGKQMQYFGARANLGKALLYAINGGRDEISGEQISPKFEPITDEYLNFDEVMSKLDTTFEWLACLYMSTLNVIHYMHDKYNFESLQLALHDSEILRTQATGIAGLSVVVDSLSAIKHARVHVIRNESGLAIDYVVEGDYPAFGNNDPEINELASTIVQKFMTMLQKHHTYRGATPTMSILTITSNVIYGEKTGATPCGRKKGEPFAPGANPIHGRDKKGAIAAMASVSSLPYSHAKDGISYTFSITPEALGKSKDSRVQNLVSMLDGYVRDKGHHINVNVFDRETLLDAMQKPELYSQLTIRVSGYAVEFTKLSRQHQLEVIARTIHCKMC
ncbi:MAG: formate C-acetyltransferase [Firmicutes bacterium]|nr:formate C-acetyltransferase [Bacillota bacterium]